MNWQPIETAPRDGTRILCWCDAAESRSGIMEMYWEGPITGQLIGNRDGWRSVISHPWENACPGPTHWIPTLEPPT